MATVPIHKQLRDCIVTTLRANVAGATFNFTTGATKVDTANFFQEEWLETSKGVLMLVRAGDVRPREAMSQEVDKQADFFVLAAKTDKSSTHNPWRASSPNNPDLQDQLAQDVENSLRKAVFDSGSCLNGLIENLDISLENREFWKDGWAIVELRVLVLYSHDAGEA